MNSQFSYALKIFKENVAKVFLIVVWHCPGIGLVLISQKAII